MTEAHKIARLIFRKWCKANGIVIHPMAGADLVSRIEAAIEIAQLTTRPQENSPILKER